MILKIFTHLEGWPAEPVPRSRWLVLRVAIWPSLRVVGVFRWIWRLAGAPPAGRGRAGGGGAGVDVLVLRAHGEGPGPAEQHGKLGVEVVGQPGGPGGAG